jgi:hypothetical protein
MPVKYECDNQSCENDIKGSKGLQATEGTVVIDHGGGHVEQDTFHGLFCSKACLREYLKDRGESQ